MNDFLHYLVSEKLTEMDKIAKNLEDGGAIRRTR